MIPHLVLKIGKSGIYIIRIKKLHLLYLLFVSLCFHNFYRLSFAYVLIPITIYLLLLLNIDRKKLEIRNSNKLFIAYVLILFMSIYIVAISFVSEGFIYTIIGITRYFYVLIIALVVFITVKNEKTVNNLLHLYVICIAIGSLTIPLQLFTGPISWFTESTNRSGLIRYSSLFGNISAMGIIGGTGLVSTLLLNYKNKNIKRFILLSILIGMGMSLQRAGIANIILAIIVYVYLIDIKSSRKIILLLTATSVVILTLLFLINYGPTKIYTSFFITSLGINSGVDAPVDYTPISNQIYYRLFTNVTVHFIERLSPILFFTGLGFSGLGGVLGQTGYNFTHNDFFNILAVGGILYLVLFLYIFLYIIIQLRKYIKISKKIGNKLFTNNLIVLLGAHLLFLFNIPMGSGNFIHPNHSILFWTTIGLLSGHYYNFFHTIRFYKGSLNAYRRV